MTAKELYKQGKLDESVLAATEEVKKKPADPECRMVLAELLCFAGDWARADKHLEAIGKQNPQSLVNIALFRQLVRGENARQQFYSEGRLPEFLEDVPDHLQLHLKASIALREGDEAEATQLIEEAGSTRKVTGGVCGDDSFQDLRDLDDLNSSFLEVITSTGKYYWVPFEKIQMIEFRKPKLTRDLIWRSAQIEVSGGPDGEIYVPVIYPTRPENGDEQLMLGRTTDWVGSDGSPVRGVGQRTFLFDDVDRSILELTKISFDTASVSND